MTAWLGTVNLDLQNISLFMAWGRIQDHYTRRRIVETATFQSGARTPQSSNLTPWSDQVGVASSRPTTRKQLRVSGTVYTSNNLSHNASLSVH